MNSAISQISEKKDFIVNSSSLKDVRSFSREVFEKLQLEQDLKDELVLAIAEAAQNIVKHAYKDISDTSDKMEITISLKIADGEFSKMVEDVVINGINSTSSDNGKIRTAVINAVTSTGG